MASCSIFIYELQSPNRITVEDIHNRLKEYPEDANAYFNLELISNVELIGEYITVQSVEETYYNPEQRLFETRITPRANIISFTIINNYLEIWSNKTNANRLIFVLSSILQPISINSIEVSLKEIINKLQYQKVKISKVCFEDFLFTEDIVGNFTVDLSSYGEAFSVIQKYRDKIANMTIIFSYENAMLKLRLTSKGRITIYKARNTLDDEALLFLHNLLIAGGTN
jgi:hypothetical protein